MKTAIPTSFPAPGVYPYGNMHVNLLSATPGAAIHYTTDGSAPTVDSPVYVQADGLLPIPAETFKDEVAVTETVIRAIAVKDGMEPSDEARFVYRIEHQPQHAYRYQVLRQEAEGPRLYCVLDYDTDRMYLIVGENRALLLDAGYDDEGDLHSLVTQLTGGLPYDCVILHGHPDHVAQANRLHEAGVTIYMNPKDDALPATFGYTMCPYEPAVDGMRFDLGGSVLRLYEVPGHTPGCMVAVEEERGWLFSSDALGNNRCEVPDSGWLQLGNPESAMERYLSAIQSFRARTAGRLTKLLTGHAYNILDADRYLDSLERAVQNAVDYGEAGLAPSLRSAADSFGSSKIAVNGDYATDLYWAAVNIGLLFTAGLTAENNALLSWVQFEDAVCEPKFDPYVTEYALKPAGETVSLQPILSSTRARMTVNGEETPSKQAVTLPAAPFDITVTAPDGSTKRVYRFSV